MSIPLKNRVLASLVTPQVGQQGDTAASPHNATSTQRSDDPPAHLQALNFETVALEPTKSPQNAEV